MAPSRHLVFSTNKAALFGFARSLSGDSDVRVELFHYSEQERLDVDALRAQAVASAESQVIQVSVLLLATAASSYLWFDPEHCPRNAELCSVLRTFPEVHVNFIVCPTTKSARDAWEQNPPDLPNVFRDFGDLLPDSGRVDLWPDFNPEHPICGEQIRSLICRRPAPLALQPVVRLEPRALPTPMFILSTVFVVLAALSAKLLVDEIEGIQIKIELHGEKIGELGSSIKWHSDSFATVKSTCDLHDVHLSTLHSQVESLKKQVQTMHVVKKRYDMCAQQIAELHAEISAGDSICTEPLGAAVARCSGEATQFGEMWASNQSEVDAEMSQKGFHGFEFWDWLGGIGSTFVSVGTLYQISW